jgi:SEC-C motif
MTLILAAGNTDQVTLVADRRFTYWDGSIHDEKNKAIVFTCLDAQLVFAFTGLAEADKFRTADWLWHSLSRAAEPDYLMLNTIARLADMATQQWTQLGYVLPERRRLSIVAVGYTYSEGSPRWYYFKITNFEREDGGIEASAEENFWVIRNRQTKPRDLASYFASVAGTRGAMKTEQLRALGELARNHAPAEALVNKSVSLIREVSKTSRFIGQQCNSVVLRSDTKLGAIAEYHTSKVSNEIYIPEFVLARGLLGGIRVRGTKIEAFDKGWKPRPLTVPRIRSDYPCPCRSGKRYKDCHGSDSQNL